MPVEMTMLVYAVILTIVQMLVHVNGAILKMGPVTLAGNRVNLPEFEGWTGRALRAHRNMLENLVLFAPLVLAVQVMGKNNDMTALGAQIFFWSRAAYAVIYLIGIPWARTLSWMVSMGGIVLLIVELL